MNARKLFHIIVAFMAAMISFYFLMPFNVSSQEGVLNTPQDQVPVVATPSPLTAQASEPIIIDHASTDLSKIPDYWLGEAKKLAVHYAHTSHGSQINSGLARLEQIDPKYSFYRFTAGSTPPSSLPCAAGELCMYDGNPPETYITPEDYWRGSSGLNRTRAVASTGFFGFSMWSFCGQAGDYDSSYIQEYLDAMTQLESEYPNMRFILMTGHTEGATGTGAQRLLANNQIIRQYASDHDMILFDFADIEMYDPLGGGPYYNDGEGNCTWCESFCTSHPEYCTNLPSSCAHTDNHPEDTLFCKLKGNAFWWMMARLAGWSGIVDENFSINTTGSASTGDNGDTITYTVVVRSLTGPASTTVNLRVELPANLVYVPQTFTTTTGTVTDTGPLLWSGVLSPTSVATITYAVTVNTAINTPHIISHTATVSAWGSETVTTTATLMANAEKTYIPIVLK